MGFLSGTEFKYSSKWPEASKNQDSVTSGQYTYTKVLLRRSAGLRFLGRVWDCWTRRNSKTSLGQAFLEKTRLQNHLTRENSARDHFEVIWGIPSLAGSRAVRVVFWDTQHPKSFPTNNFPSSVFLCLCHIAE